MNKFKLNFLHLADNVNISQLGKLNISGIFDRISCQ